MEQFSLFAFSFAKFTYVFGKVLFFYVHFRQFVKAFNVFKVNVKLSRCFRIEDNFTNAIQHIFRAWKNWITGRGHFLARCCLECFTCVIASISHRNSMIMASVISPVLYRTQRKVKGICQGHFLRKHHMRFSLVCLALKQVLSHI